MSATGVWLLSFCLALPPLVGWAEYGYLPGQSFCFCRWTTSISYTIFMVAVCFGGPCSTMTFCYVNILREVRQSKKRISKNASQSNIAPSRTSQSGRESDTDGGERASSAVEADPQQIDIKIKEPGTLSKFKRLFSREQDNSKAAQNGIKYTMNDINSISSRPSSSKVNDGSSVISQGDMTSPRKKKRDKRRAEELRLTTSLFVVIIVFTICWFPFCITMFLSVFREEPVPRIPDIATMIFGCLNSTCNPIIYGLMNRKFRAGFAAIYCWTCRVYKQRQSQSSSSFPRSSSGSGT